MFKKEKELPSITKTPKGIFSTKSSTQQDKYKPSQLPKEHAHYDKDKIYSLKDFMDVKFVHFDIVVERLSKQGYIKRYNLTVNHEEKYIETPEDMSREDFNKHAFQTKIKQIIGVPVCLLFQATKDGEEVNSELIEKYGQSGRKCLKTDFRIGDIDVELEDGELGIVPDHLYQTCIVSWHKVEGLDYNDGLKMRFTFRDMGEKGMEENDNN